ETGYARPAVARVDEEGQRAGRVLHFDYSEDSPEGTDLARERLELAADDDRLGWVLANGLMGPMNASFWLQPRAIGDARLLDVGGASQQSDRVSLLFEGEDLVLRVLDAPGDHPDTTFAEVAEVRYELAGDGAGIPADVWTHFEVDVRGNRGDQMLLRVDGIAQGRTLGLTELTEGLGPDSTEIAVESTEGFPDRCVLRIGDELIEAVVTGPTSFSAVHEVEGQFAGFGGRLAREEHSWAQGDDEASVPLFGLAKDGSHPFGTPVQHYGYPLVIDTTLPPGGSELEAELGPFAVGRIVGVEGAQTPTGDPVVSEFEGAGLLEELQLGYGWDPATTAATGLLLEAPDAQAGQTVEDVMGAFQADGGYAAVVQQRIVWNVDGVVGDPPITVDGTHLHQIGLVHYTGVDGNVLLVDDWAVGQGTLPNVEPTALLPQLGLPAAFIVDWDIQSPFVAVTSEPSSDDLDATLLNQPFVVPISLRAPGAGGGFDFVAAIAGESQFAQLTERDAAENTEWVRYDAVITDHLVRDDPQALDALYIVLAIGDRPANTDTTPEDEEDDDDEGGGGGSGDSESFSITLGAA
ncbi:MAG TPA: hypothetical protein VJP77_06110, partial [Planctomycetota bacterium]|nr:hypothetical protein [Planctomycetota bacterium]